MPRNGLNSFAIRHITVYWILLQLTCLLLIWMDPPRHLETRLMFNPDLVVHGEWWRVFTFLFMPFSTDPIWAAVEFYFYWIAGTALENKWGVGNYNLFLLLGAVLNIAAGFIPYLLSGHGHMSSNIYIIESVFLAFAAFYPEFVVMLFFVLPVKIKWLAMGMCAVLAWQFFQTDWTGRAMIFASLANFFIFFSSEIIRNVKHGSRLVAGQMRVAPATANTTLHCCVVCGITEKTAPDAEFRYCSHCGGKCYCLVHLKDHDCPLNAPH